MIIIKHEMYLAGRINFYSTIESSYEITGIFIQYVLLKLHFQTVPKCMIR